VSGWGCYGDAFGHAVGLGTLEKILLDGANGVTQAARVCGRLEPAALAIFSVAALAGLVLAYVRRRRAAGVWLIALLGISYVPGLVQLTLVRGDRPAVQRSLEHDVAAARERYLAAIRQSLAGVPTSTCFSPTFDAYCIIFTGIYLGADQALTHRRCIGGEPARVSVAVTACGVDHIAVDLVR
jgi:hypothetical protein